MNKKTRIQRTTLELQFKGYTYGMTQKKMVLPDTQRHAEELTKIRKDGLLEQRGKTGKCKSDPNKIITVLNEEDNERYKQLAQLLPAAIHDSSTIFLSLKTN
jgi:hypothetical protein